MAENGDAPEPKQEPVIIGLIVKDQAGTEVMFKVTILKGHMSDACS
jgi:hypothetical protein